MAFAGSNLHPHTLFFFFSDKLLCHVSKVACVGYWEESPAL